MAHNQGVFFFKNLRMKQFILFSVIIMLVFSSFAQTKSKTKSKNTSRKSVTKVKTVTRPGNKKLPHELFLTLIDSADVFVVNHATESSHIDLPQKHFNTFNSYIMDSVATEIPGLKSIIYYHYTMKDGRVIIGDIFWNDTTGYIVFKIYDKKFVNYYSKEGVQQLKALFKL